MYKDYMIACNSNGKFYIVEYDSNAVMFTSYTDELWNVPEFESWDEANNYLAKLLFNELVDRGLVENSTKEYNDCIEPLENMIINYGYTKAFEICCQVCG